MYSCEMYMRVFREEGRKEERDKREKYRHRQTEREKKRYDAKV